MGFDIQRIAKIESVPGEHFCPVCQLLINPNEALQSMCGHLYCMPCLSHVASTTMACPYDGYLVTETDAVPLVESNKVLADTIGKTVVYCVYQNSGCTWLGPMAASPLHDLRCAFGNSLVMCIRCGTKIRHFQWREHVQVCPGRHVMATSHASAQDHGVGAATLTQDQWYQQPYHQYYQNDGDGYSMHQQRLHLPSLAPQHQVLYVHPATHYGAQNQTHFPNVLPPAPASLPQAYPSVPSHPQHPSLTFPASQGLTNVQAQSHFQQVPDVHPPQPLPTMHNQEPSSPRTQYWREMVRKYGRAPVPESSGSLPQQHTTAPTSDIVAHNQMHQGGHFQNQHLAQRSEKHPQTLQPVPPTFEPGAPIRPSEEHEADFEFRRASRFSQPSTDLRDRQFRGGRRSPIGEHLGMPSHGFGTLDNHGLGGSGDETTDTEGRDGFGLHGRFVKGPNDLQMGEKAMIGPNIRNGLRLPDIEFRNKYTSQGFSGGGGSFPGNE